MLVTTRTLHRLPVFYCNLKHTYYYIHNNCNKNSITSLTSSLVKRGSKMWCCKKWNSFVVVVSLYFPSFLHSDHQGQFIFKIIEQVDNWIDEFRIFCLLEIVVDKKHIQFSFLQYFEKYTQAHICWIEKKVQIIRRYKKAILIKMSEIHI